MEVTLAIMAVGALIFLAHVFSSLFERTRIPDVLPLVFLGLLVGPVLGLVTPTAFGRVGSVFTTVSLLVILFQSGLGLDWSTLRESMLPGIRLTVINFVMTVVAIGLISVPLFQMSFLEGFILGAILGGTSSAVVIPLVNKLSLGQGPRTVLVLESTFSDVLCIVVTLALIQSVKYHELRPGLMLGQILASFLLAAVIGTLAAFFWSTVLNRIRRLENSTFTTPAFVFIVFGVAELLGYSGAISALAFGVALGNSRSFQLPVVKGLALLRPIKLQATEEALFSEMVFLFKTFFFVYIGLSIRLTDRNLVLAGVGLTLIAFITRIPVVRLAMNRVVKSFDASVASVMVPKGLAAAVLASLPLQAGVEKGAAIQDVVYAVILFSIMATAILTFLIEKHILRQPYAFVFSNYATDTSSTEEIRSEIQ
jgi:NhaP-type Na+/H+ or K+/H+ antiporter